MALSNYPFVHASVETVPGDNKVIFFEFNDKSKVGAEIVFRVVVFK